MASWTSTGSPSPSSSGWTVRGPIIRPSSVRRRRDLLERALAEEAQRDDLPVGLVQLGDRPASGACTLRSKCDVLRVRARAGGKRRDPVVERSIGGRQTRDGTTLPELADRQPDADAAEPCAEGAVR